MTPLEVGWSCVVFLFINAIHRNILVLVIPKSTIFGHHCHNLLVIFIMGATLNRHWGEIKLLNLKMVSIYVMSALSNDQSHCTMCSF